MTSRIRADEPLPYYRWYWRDWRGSRAVQRMSALERGIYRELLDEQWKSGALRNDPAWLAEAAMCTEQELASVWRVLTKCFPPIEGGGGELLANQRLEAERTEQDALRVKRTQAGALGGKANAKQVPNSSSSSRAEQSSSRIPEASASASPPLGASASAEPMATPDQIRAIMDGLTGRVS